MDPTDSNKRAASPACEKSVESSKRLAVEDSGTGEPKAKSASSAEESALSSLDIETVVVRAIIDSKHTGTIIGKGGSTISWIRSQSKAKVNISDADRTGTVDERVVTVTGTCAGVFRAFSFICDKIKDSQQQQAQSNPSIDTATVTMRLAIPHVQAGAIIGKQGAKIKEIRDATGANIKVDQEMLPNSTERCCVVVGGVEPVAQSIFHIACTLLQVPAKGQVIPYMPGGGQPPIPSGMRGFGAGYGGGPNTYGGYGAPSAPNAFGAQQAGYAAPQIQQSLNVSNDIVGAIIGRAGSKINEIRQTSQASIKIADKVPGAVDRQIIMSGTPEAVQMAQYLIQTRMQEAMMAQHTGGAVS